MKERLTMPYSAKTVANEFLHLAKEEGRSLTPMQLVKLVYFAYGWYWVIANDRLINERIQAWEYGPVVPSIYHEFKRFGNRPINGFASELTPVGDGNSFTFQLDDPRIPESDTVARQLIKRVWDVYKGFSAIQLSQMTHEFGTPWAETPNKEVKGTSIDDDRIKDYFNQLARNNAAGRATEA